MKKIAIFVSGTGSNARKIIEKVATTPAVEVALLLSNKVSAPALQMAAEHGVPTRVIKRKDFYGTEEILEELKEVDLLVLAGFLWLVPSYLVEAFPNRIINIHPALLPKYGGKGMYGMNVHKAVKAAGEEESGITIHFVNEQYDEGAVIFQASCSLLPEDSAEEIAKKVLALEHQHFPRVVLEVLSEV